MIPGLLLRPRLIAALNKAISWAQEPSFARILLAQPPLSALSGCEVVLHRGQPLRETGQTRRNQPHFFAGEWRRQRLHSIRFPYLACLLEGEMDWRIGITRSMAKALPEPLAQCNQLTLRFLEGQFFLMPPGVPYSDGTRIHWARPHPERAHYKVLWMHLLPTGTFCHLSGVLRGERFYEAPLYIHDPRVYLLSDFLLEELRTRDASFEAVARNQLHSVLLRVRRYLGEQPPFPISGGNQDWRHKSAQHDVRAILAGATTNALQRACAYIESHLHEPLQAEVIARQAFVSSSHLNRLFSVELGLPLMRYVTNRRMEIAQSLLTHSQLPVQEIGRQVGYPNPSHFSQVFTRENGQNPQSYRNGQHADQDKLKS